jgi:hypothetical protein
MLRKNNMPVRGTIFFAVDFDPQATIGFRGSVSQSRLAADDGYRRRYGGTTFNERWRRGAPARFRQTYACRRGAGRSTTVYQYLNDQTAADIPST